CRRRRTRRRRNWGTPSVTPGGAGWTRVVSPGGRTVASPVLVEDHLRRRRREGGAEPEEFGGLAFHCCEEGRCAVRAASSALMAYSQGQLNPVLPSVPRPEQYRAPQRLAGGRLVLVLQEALGPGMASGEVGATGDLDIPGPCEDPAAHRAEGLPLHG